MRHSETSVYGFQVRPRGGAASVASPTFKKGSNVARSNFATILDVLRNVLLLFIGAVMTLSISVVREISDDVTAIRVMVASESTSAADVKRRTERLELKVFGR